MNSYAISKECHQYSCCIDAKWVAECQKNPDENIAKSFGESYGKYESRFNVL